jgi:hypothetical protein
MFCLVLRVFAGFSQAQRAEIIKLSVPPPFGFFARNYFAATSSRPERAAFPLAVPPGLH